ncbi:MAG: putative secondary metabolism biosynthetic enzyme [Pycnora praestabilis]|nr:MAG: putative secondary metabolism biosynthetic enzyme [Pycnora praestabilis]
MHLPTEAKAQVLKDFNQPYSLSTVPINTSPRGKDVLIKVGAASYCHTDAVYASGAMGKTLPIINCHEFAGTIVALGPDVQLQEIRIGTRVGVPGRAFRCCGTCWECRNGEDSMGYSVYCPHAGNLGITRDGGFQEYATIDSRQVALIPEKLSFVDTAPLMCAGLTVYAALKACKLEKGASIGIVGCGGGLGHLGLQFGTLMGYRIVGVDNSDSALKLANGLNTGASIYDVRLTQPEDILAQTEGVNNKPPSERGLDAVLVLPESQKAFEYGMKLLHNHGLGVIVCFPSTGFNVSARDLVFRDIRLIGSLVGSNATLREMLKFAAMHGIRAVTKTFPLKRLNELVEEYHKAEGGKLVVDMSLES